MLETPVLFLVFNRPEVTQTVFERIRLARPKYLFVAADGPRFHKNGESEKCEQTRSLVMQAIDWPCEVKTLFREENLGCKVAVSSAITWFFDNVEEGIILEDDCLPDLSFFSYCEILLEKYRHNTSILHISGNNFLPGSTSHHDSYYYSNYVEIWGWATWKRAWKLYDLEMRRFPVLKQSRFLCGRFKSDLEEEYWMKVLTNGFHNTEDTWDYQWVFSIYSNSGICINPHVNLVSNIGYGIDATHTTQLSSQFSNLPTGSMVDIIHPEAIVVNKELDHYVFISVIALKPAFSTLIRQQCKQILRLIWNRLSKTDN